jgi:protein-disulfide isomerase
MKRITLFGLVSVLILLALIAAGRNAAGRKSLAKVNGEPISSAEIENLLAAQLTRLQEQIYTLKRQKLEEVINATVLTQEAAKRKISVSELLDAEVAAKVGLVTEQEVEQFYQENRFRLQGEETTLRQQIKQHLESQKLSVRTQEFVQSLRSRADVVLNLKAPEVLRAQISAAGAPFKGEKKATVTIVKFEDFHCPFCKQVQPTLSELLSRYGDKVKIVHRDFPIDSIHPQARKAHEAARCAHEQGKFWE